MRKLTFAMNLSLDGYIAAPGDDIGWSVPSDELFQWWSDRVGATGLALYGRRLWEGMSAHWPTADRQPGATPAAIEFAGRSRDMPKVVFSSTISAVDWNTRLVTGDAVTDIHTGAQGEHLATSRTGRGRRCRVVSGGLVCGCEMRGWRCCRGGARARTARSGRG